MANFARKNLDPTGTYHRVLKMGTDDMGQPKIEEQLTISGREIFSTDKKSLIEKLRADEEIIEIDKETTIEPNGGSEE